MSIDNTYLRFTHRATNGIVYTYIFQLSSSNNFNTSSYSYETILGEFVSNLGDIERGFEDDLNIGLELTGTCKVSFNLKADIGNSEVMNEFRSQILCEHVPATVDNFFFGIVRIPLRLTVKKGNKIIFDGVMAFKTQSEITVSQNSYTIDVEFIDIARAAGEICRFDNDLILPYCRELLGTSSLRHRYEVYKNIHSMALVNRYIANENVVHHLLLLPTDITMATTSAIFEVLGRFYAAAYGILTRALVNPTQSDIIQANQDTAWLFGDGNPFYNMQVGVDSNYYCDNPLRGWTFHTQDVINSVDGSPNPTTTALNLDQLLMICWVNIKSENGTFDMDTISDGFLTNGKDGGNLGTCKNLYEFVKLWAKSFYHKVIVVHEGGSFRFEVRSLFEQTNNAIITDISQQNIEAEYKIKRGALASNFKANLSEATNGNEDKAEINNGLENDTALEHEIFVQSGNKFVDTSESFIGYTGGGWNYTIFSANPYNCLYYDGTSIMNSEILQGRNERKLCLSGVKHFSDEGVTNYFFKVNEKCFYSSNFGTEKILIDKPALPEFITAEYGGEAGDGYFDDAGDVNYVNEGDARKESKFDQFNAYQSECLNTLGQPTLINKWNSDNFGKANTELIELSARGIGLSAVNIGQLVYDATPLGIESIDNSTRYGVLTKIVESPWTGTLNLTILSVKP